MSTVSEQEYQQRISQLERLNASLAAQVDRMRPVVDVARRLTKAPSFLGRESLELMSAVTVYEHAMAALEKGGR